MKGSPFVTLVNMTGLVCASYPHHFVICKQFINFERERGQRALAVLFCFFFPVSFRSSISLTGVKYFLFKNVTFLAQDLRQICIIYKTRRCHVYTNLFMAKLGLSPRHPISFAFLFILPFVSFILSIPQFLNGSAPAQMFVHFLDKSIEYSQLFLKKRFSQLS